MSLKSLTPSLAPQCLAFECAQEINGQGKQQHGFKRKKSTATAGALLQSLISRAADDNCYVIMASLDLSMAFDLVNTELLTIEIEIEQQTANQQAPMHHRGTTGHRRNWLCPLYRAWPKLPLREIENPGQHRHVG